MFFKTPSIGSSLGACNKDTIEFLEQLIEKEDLRALPEKALRHRWLTANPKGFGNRTITPTLANYCLGIINKGLDPSLIKGGRIGKPHKKGGHSGKVQPSGFFFVRQN